MNDNYSHCDTKLLYLTESIPGPKENSIEFDKLLEDYNTQFDGCDCNPECNVPVCKCLQLSYGINYERFKSKDIGGQEEIRLKKLNLETYPIYECSSNCSCHSTCGNRVVQIGPIQGLIVKTCINKLKGLGLFTCRIILKGTFICEYAGEILTKTQAVARTAENEILNHNNYIFCLNEYSTTETVQTFVDPSKFGNIGRYINHSCDPNCSIVPVRYDSPIPKLAIFACKNIEPNEEITFQYGIDSDNTHNIKDKILLKKCFCNSVKCKGYLPFSNF